MTIGESIQKHRKAKNMSQEDLGERLLLPRQTISLWEKDQTAPTLDNLMRLKEIFGVSMDELIGGDEILKKVAKILLEVFDGAEYRVYRIGGDEFSVLVEGDREAEVIERLLNLKSILAKNGDICLSKGYAFTHTNFKKAFRYADEMLYADKISRNTRNINKDDN